MIIPYITQKQQDIPNLLYKFRILNRLHIQKLLNHKDKRRINSWLKDLRQKHYVEKFNFENDNTFEARTKLAVYYIGLNSIRFLKSQEGICESVIKKLYHDKDRSENFTRQCLLVADCFLAFKNSSDERVSYYLFTSSDLENPSSPFYFLKSLNPHLVILKKETDKNRTTKKYFLLEVFEPTLPRYSIRKRLKNYLDFYFENQWENEIKKTFPVLLFVCPTKPDLIYAKRFAKKLIDDNHNPKDFHIKFAEVSKIQKFGVTSKIIWEEAGKKYANG